MSAIERVKGVKGGFLSFGEAQTECYRLPDGSRVVSTRGAVRAIAGKDTGDLASYVRPALRQKGGGAEHPKTSSKTVVLANKTPKNKQVESSNGVAQIRFEHDGNEVAGIEAAAFLDICETIVNAGLDGRLRTERQMEIARRCNVILKACSRVGLVALIDEATDTQEARERGALAEILDHYVSKELRPVTKRFPLEFFRLYFKLRGWRWPENATGVPRSPRCIAGDINFAVYQRLLPSVLPALQALNPTDASGRRKYKLYRHLTEPAIAQLDLAILNAMALMRAAKTWPQFKRLMNEASPVSGTQPELPIDFERPCPAPRARRPAVRKPKKNSAGKR